MKNILYIAILILAFVACEDEVPVFPDYDYTAVYFPHQFPVRTLEQGNSFFNPDNSNERTFKIGVLIGGLRENTKDRTVQIKVDPSIAQDLVTDAGDSIYVLPEAYYTLSNNNTITIPKGQLNGVIEVTVNDTFFADPLSIGNHYVLPIVIVDAEADRVLEGVPVTGVTSPDRLVAEDWEGGITPRDFTLFGIKYINDMDGTFLYKGRDEKTYLHYGSSASYYPMGVTETKTKYVEKRPLVRLKTTSTNSVSTNFCSSYISDVGEFTMNLTLNEDGTVKVDSVSSSFIKPFQSAEELSQSRFVQNGEKWGGKLRDVLYLQYSYQNSHKLGINLNHVKDTIIFRNRNVTFETFSPVKQ